MQYKTIVLALLEQRPNLHQTLKRQRKLLAAMEQYALELKASHEAWKVELALLKPERSPDQITSEALELALQGLEHRLPSESPVEENDPVSPEETLNLPRHPTPTA